MEKEDDLNMTWLLTWIGKIRHNKTRNWLKSMHCLQQLYESSNRIRACENCGLTGLGVPHLIFHRPQVESRKRASLPIDIVDVASNATAVPALYSTLLHNKGSRKKIRGLNEIGSAVFDESINRSSSSVLRRFRSAIFLSYTLCVGSYWMLPT